MDIDEHDLRIDVYRCLISGLALPVCKATGRCDEDVCTVQIPTAPDWTGGKTPEEYVSEQRNRGQR